MLHHFTLTQHNQLMTERAHHLQIMADKQIGELMLLLQTALCAAVAAAVLLERIRAERAAVAPAARRARPTKATA